jgi:hypothetical protein
MRFVRVVSADPACAPNCPEWLSAEGRIGPGAATDLAAAIERLSGRRLPILIHSPGGSVPDAMAMGALIRAKGLAVAVARTSITNCPEAASKCPDGPGAAITGGAACASACVLVLAGGVERLAGPMARIGVHQTTTLVKEPEGLAHRTSTRKLYQQQGVDAEVEAYLAAMGVDEPVMTLMRKTPAASVHWLSLGDLKASRLATLALDGAQPILTGGANGLNGRAFDGDPPGADLAQASVDIPLTRGDAPLGITFRYRRGGGAVEAEVMERGLEVPQADPLSRALSLTLSAAGAEPLQLKTAGTAPPLIPRERFCALAHGDAMIAARGVRPAAGVPAGRVVRDEGRGGSHRRSLSLTWPRRAAQSRRPPREATNTTRARIPSKQIQIKPSKKAWISLVLFVRIGTFQWVASEKIKKLTRVSGCVQNVSIASHASSSEQPATFQPKRGRHREPRRGVAI